MEKGKDKTRRRERRVHSCTWDRRQQEAEQTADSRKTTDGKWKKIKQEGEREGCRAAVGTGDNKKQCRQQTPAMGKGKRTSRRERVASTCLSTAQYAISSFRQLAILSYRTNFNIKP
jgi:hypothetical protein